MIYLQFIRFLLPLVVTILVQEFGGQVLHAGMARMPQATEIFAAYGVAWGWVMLLINPLAQIRQLGLVLAEDRQAGKVIHRFVVLIGVGLAGVLALFLFEAPGIGIIETVHGIAPNLSALVREILVCCIPIPLLKGLTYFYSGLLLRVRRTDILSYAVVIGIGVSIVGVFVLLPVGWVNARPIRLPLLVTYLGIVTELGLTYWGYARYVAGHLPEQQQQHGLTLSTIAHFFWPLAVIMVVQASSRPLINLVISRGSNGTEALAVLTVVYTLGHLPYGWLNELRNLPPAFRAVAKHPTAIRRFALGCGILSFAVMALLFWTPAQRYILEELIGIQPAFAALCARPLAIFVCFPLVVMTRAYIHGIGLVTHRTRDMAPSAPARIIGILLILLCPFPFAMDGATRGVLALLSGFVVETVVVWRGVAGARKKR